MINRKDEPSLDPCAPTQEPSRESRRRESRREPVTRPPLATPFSEPLRSAEETSGRLQSQIGVSFRLSPTRR